MTSTLIQSLIKMCFILHFVHDIRTLRGQFLTTRLLRMTHIVAIAHTVSCFEGLVGLNRQALKVSRILVTSCQERGCSRSQIECVRYLIFLRAAYVDLRLKVLKNLAEGLLRLTVLAYYTSFMKIDMDFMTV